MIPVYGSPSDELCTAVHNVTGTPLTKPECVDILGELRILGYEIIRTLPDSTPAEDSQQEGCPGCGKSPCEADFVNLSDDTPAEDSQQEGCPGCLDTAERDILPPCEPPKSHVVLLNAARDCFVAQDAPDIDLSGVSDFIDRIQSQGFDIVEQDTQKCGTCGGAGALHYSDNDPCPDCGGTGRQDTQKGEK